jgi:hypothetical protein
LKEEKEVVAKKEEEVGSSDAAGEDRVTEAEKRSFPC